MHRLFCRSNGRGCHCLGRALPLSGFAVEDPARLSHVGPV